jgi:hypothetical protein
MSGATQRHGRHQVPKTKRPVAPRLNLTFRHVGRPVKKTRQVDPDRPVEKT